MKSRRTKPNWIHLEHGLFLSHCMHVSEKMRQTGGGKTAVTYLPLGSMTVKARLSGAVTPALAMVDVEVKLKIDHFSVEVNESVRVIIHVTGESK